MATEQSTLRSRSRYFYVSGAVVALIIMFWGFAKTFFLKDVYGAPAIRPLVLIHGVVMTLWFTLFLVQCWLIASRRVKLHMRLGIFGAFLAVTLVLLGAVTAISAARLGHSPGPPPLVFLVVPLVDLLVFSILVGLGLHFRANRETHRRLMLLAALSLLTAAIARIPVPAIHDRGILMYFGVKDLVVLAFVAYDTWKSRRLHPAFGWGALLIIVSGPLRLMLGGTHLWMQFAQWVTR